ncbi:hypothetical protein [Microbispora sp. NBRC 16548]|uniref:hypothetical protein n=1 Tax=Microbispora sp. NBRC 16548 TaxID=3030994 RepID=UPI0016210869|nr:hypothetical protein [Microbispora sp. NBRC 16548]GLX10039.1 hypothetical protein Misp03_69650 [Microbispora sp. NBRC 16548]
MREARKFLIPGALLSMADSVSTLLGVDVVVPWPLKWGIRLVAMTLMVLALILISRSHNRDRGTLAFQSESGRDRRLEAVRTGPLDWRRE